jgi:drug/metabolite transporter (DMT)-like permease
MSVRREADAFSFQLMLLLCALWGLQQVSIKLAAADLAPILQASARSGIAALLVGLLMCWRGGWEGLRQGTLPAGLLAGVLFALEFLLIAQGLVYTTAGHIAVFLYTSPVFSALGLHLLLPGERLRPLQWLGIAVCFGGIAVAFVGGASLAQLDPRMLLGDALGVLAGLAWGATTVVVRASKLSEAPPGLTLFYQLFVAFVLLLGLGVAGGQAAHVALTPVVLGSLLFQGVVVSFASYLAWFWLLRRYQASSLAVFSFMTPLFGVTAGVLVLGEPLAANFVVGAVLVLLGIGLVSGEARLRALFRRRTLPSPPVGKA